MSNRVKEFQRSFDSRKPKFEKTQKKKMLLCIDEEDVIIGSQNNLDSECFSPTFKFNKERVNSKLSSPKKKNKLIGTSII
jgi:hypothetical protein